MAEIRFNDLAVQTGYLKQPSEVYVKQEPYVGEDGLYVPVHEYVQEGCASAYRCIMSKEMFVEAYNKYINKNKRRYKGGWKK